MKINIDNFHFVRNSKVIKVIEDDTNFLQNVPTIFYKKLGIKKKDINNITIDLILDKLEDNKNQKKIINYITDYKKIPQKTINHFKNVKSIYQNKKNIKIDITDNEIKQIIIDFLRIKYNQYSIFNIDISFIYFEGWNRNCLDEEGPSDYIFDRIKELKGKKESSCIIL
jgi:hypothetical protein